MSSMRPQDARAYQEWQELCERIRQQTGVAVRETPAQKQARKEKLSGDFVAFCKYYFPHYMDADFGWFHIKAAKEITATQNCFAVLEWAREHAKSVFANIMMPLFLYARGELSGMVTASATQDKAITLLSDIQAQFEANGLWINDYGNLVTLGDWQSGQFATSDGIGFWAFGRGQSPRGIRKAARRPNYAVVDDIDDKVIVRNEQRVKDAVDWVIEDLYGALSIQGARLVVAGNRIHKKSILAHLVGDVEPGDPKRSGIIHIKVYAIEDKRHRKADAKTGQPAWKERYTLQQLLDKMEVMGWRSSRREYFHEHIEEGLVFKNDWIVWRKTLPWSQYDDIVVYCDPSWKDTKDSDYKAILAIGKKGLQIDVKRAWVRQGSASAMVNVFYDLYTELESRAQYYIEANMLQDLLLDEFTRTGEERGFALPIRPDKRSKPDKYTRIENLSPLFERGLIGFDEKMRTDGDFQTLKDQLLAFPFGHDDAPDALEGGIFYLQKRGRSSSFRGMVGKYRQKNDR